MQNSNIPFRTMIDLVEAANRIGGGDRHDDTEEAEPVSEDLSGGMFGEYRLERANNPRRQRQGRGNKGSEAQYCLRVYSGDSPFGWIIPLMGTEGKPIGYSFHYDEHPHDEGFKFYAFTYGSMKKTLDALKNEFLNPNFGKRRK